MTDAGDRLPTKKSAKPESSPGLKVFAMVLRELFLLILFVLIIHVRSPQANESGRLTRRRAI